MWWVEVSDIFLGSFQMLLKQDSDHLTEAFDYHGRPRSYLTHSSAFSFIIKPSSIILLICMLSQACAGAINISIVFFCACVCEKGIVCACISLLLLLQLNLKQQQFCSLCMRVWTYVSLSDCMWRIPGANQFINDLLCAWWRVQIAHIRFYSYLHILCSHSDLHISTNTLIHKVVSTWQHRLKSTCWVQSYCICLLRESPANRNILLWSNSLGGLLWFFGDLHLDI